MNDYIVARKRLMIVAYLTMFGALKGLIGCFQIETEYLSSFAVLLVCMGYLWYFVIFVYALLLRLWVEDARRTLFTIYTVDFFIVLSIAVLYARSFLQILFFTVVLLIRFYFVWVLMDKKVIRLIEYKGKIDQIPNG